MDIAESRKKWKDLEQQPNPHLPLIKQMLNEAEEMIKEGKMEGHLAVYWIDSWIRCNPKCEYHYVSPHPGNFRWQFLEIHERSASDYAIKESWNRAMNNL